MAKSPLSESEEKKLEIGRLVEYDICHPNTVQEYGRGMAISWWIWTECV